MDAGIARRIGDLAARHRGLALLLVFGSRARGDASGHSDWDFGYLANDASFDPAFDPDALLADLVSHLAVDRIDLVDLARASALLRYRAAAEGSVVYTRSPALFERFWTDAVSFWCDAEPVLRRGYAAVLENLPG